MNRVKELAEIMDISQKQLTVDLGVSQSTLSDWMNQKKDPKGENLQKIADYFGVNPMVVKGLAPIPADYAANVWGYNKYEEQPQTDRLDGIRFALNGEIHDLTDDEAQDILDYVRFKKAKRNDIR